MSISDNVRTRMAEGSWIRKMFEEAAVLKQRYGEENVFDLSLGNPVMEPPPEFEEELKRLVPTPLSFNPIRLISFVCQMPPGFGTGMVK